MAYTLDEQNHERQQLLARVLNPLTRPVLERANVPAGGRCLDLGCGLGHTTRLLAHVLRPAECIGLEYDARLVAEAAAHPENPAGVRFQQGDATQLPFADGTFDVVFTRYLLVHLPDPVKVIREMLRVARPGGTVLAYEPDCSSQFAHPPSWAMDRMGAIWDGLFADARIGRKLVHHFRAAGASKLEAGGAQAIETDGNEMKRLYRFSLESAAAAIAERNLLTRQEFEAMLQEFLRLENDADTICMKFPDFWVIASQ
jgi:SAM-dependent methyltransferase